MTTFLDEAESRATLDAAVGRVVRRTGARGL
jgi:hypothetical protein